MKDLFLCAKLLWYFWKISFSMNI